MNLIEYYRDELGTAELSGYAEEKTRHLIHGKLPFISPYAYSRQAKNLAARARTGDTVYAYSEPYGGVIARGFVIAPGRPFTEQEAKVFQIGINEGHSRYGLIYTSWVERFKVAIPQDAVVEACGMRIEQWRGHARIGLIPCEKKLVVHNQAA